MEKNETYQLHVDNRSVTVEPHYKDGVIYFSISENGSLLFILHVNEQDEWEASNEAQEPANGKQPVDMEFALIIGNAIERRELMS